VFGALGASHDDGQRNERSAKNFVVMTEKNSGELIEGTGG
jgi:hypothetical protein